MNATVACYPTQWTRLLQTTSLYCSQRGTGTLLLELQHAFAPRAIAQCWLTTSIREQKRADLDVEQWKLSIMIERVNAPLDTTMRTKPVILEASKRERLNVAIHC